jgi:hypothetical protein
MAVFHIDVSTDRAYRILKPFHEVQPGTLNALGIRAPLGADYSAIGRVARRDLRTRTCLLDRRCWTRGLFQAPCRWRSRVCLLLLAVLIVTQPLFGFAPVKVPNSSLVELADNLASPSASLQSIRPDLSRCAPILCPPNRPFLHICRSPIICIRDGRPFYASESANYARLLTSLYSGRSPPTTRG